MIEKSTTFGPAELLTSDEAIATFMADAFESGDAGCIAHALGVVARARSMAEIAIPAESAGSSSVPRDGNNRV